MNHKLRVLILVFVLIGAGGFFFFLNQRQASLVSPHAVSLRPATEQTSKPEETPTPTSTPVSEPSSSYKDVLKDVVVTTVENNLSPYVETFVVKGLARGTWFFEGSFPVELQDANGNIMKTIPAKADGEWMTQDFVPFTAKIDYALGKTKTGFLLLKKDNPSGDPVRDDAFKIPVTFPGVQ